MDSYEEVMSLTIDNNDYFFYKYEWIIAPRDCSQVYSFKSNICLDLNLNVDVYVYVDLDAC